MTKKRYFHQPEVTLTQFGIELMFPQLLQHKSQVFLMFFLSLGLDQDIINKDYHKLIQILHKNFIHQIHKVS